MTSQYLVFKIAHFVEINRRYQPAKFHWPRLSGSKFTRAGRKHPPPPPTGQIYTLSKRPLNPYRVKAVLASLQLNRLYNMESHVFDSLGEQKYNFENR